MRLAGDLRLAQGAEVLDVLGGAGHDHLVLRLDEGLGPGVDEVLTDPLDPDDRHAILRADAGLGERLAPLLVVGHGASDGEVVVELEVLRHPSDDHVSHLLTHRAFGIDDVVDAEPLEDPALGLGARLGPDVGDLVVDEGQGRHDAGLHVVGDADDGLVEGLDAQLLESVAVGAVGLNDVGELVGVALHADLVEVDGHDLLAHRDE